MISASLKKFLPQSIKHRAHDALALLDAWRQKRKFLSRSIEPVSRLFGFDRGVPIDRYYIERFLEAHRSDIRGKVLEIGGSDYTERFGGGRVESSDVLHAVEGNPKATIIGNLATGQGIPQMEFDCIILTQTLPFIYDFRKAVENAHAALRPGGIVLATVPGISQISRYDMDRWGDYWRFTSLSAQRLFEEAFEPESLIIETHGNVLVAAAFLYGLTVSDLKQSQINHKDPDYEVLITIRAARNFNSEASSIGRGDL